MRVSKYFCFPSEILKKKKKKKKTKKEKKKPIHDQCEFSSYSLSPVKYWKVSVVNSQLFGSFEKWTFFNKISLVQTFESYPKTQNLMFSFSLFLC